MGSKAAKNGAPWDQEPFRSVAVPGCEFRWRLATEFEFKDRFPDCELGAMPPFGNLYGMQVLVDENLAKDAEIAFNAGSHTELMRLSYQDFVTLVQPRVMRFSMPRARRAAAGEDRLW